MSPDEAFTFLGPARCRRGPWGPRGPSAPTRFARPHSCSGSRRTGAVLQETSPAASVLDRGSPWGRTCHRAVCFVSVLCPLVLYDDPSAHCCWIFVAKWCPCPPVRHTDQIKMNTVKIRDILSACPEPRSKGFKQHLGRVGGCLLPRRVRPCPQVRGHARAHVPTGNHWLQSVLMPNCNFLPPVK